MQIKYSDSRGSKKKVLDVGSGDDDQEDHRMVFRNDTWERVRLDIDPSVNPDLIGSITELDQLCLPNSFDAVYSSHSIEHLFAHEVLPALRGFHRALKVDGFVLIACPDLEMVLTQVLKNGLDTPLYSSPAGPIAGLDILFGHTQSISRGKVYMAHRTGFTSFRLGNFLVQAGFAKVVVDRLGWDLLAVGMREKADQDTIRQELRSSGLSTSL